jgi:hypothetical protein
MAESHFTFNRLKKKRASDIIIPKALLNKKSGKCGELNFA